MLSFEKRFLYEFVIHKFRLMYVLFLISSGVNILSGQVPPKLWDNTFQGTYDDYLCKAIKTSDGNYLLGGKSNSMAGGPKSVSSITSSSHDPWLIKVDDLGQKVWDKTILSLGDHDIEALLNTPDGGYLILSYTRTHANYEQSEGTNGMQDLWVN